MTSAAPRILAVETDSAWVVILVVSFVTLVAALLLRRLIGRPGGTASGLLLLTPLVLPPAVAAAYQHSVLPEIAVLQPVSGALARESKGLLHLLLFTDPTSHVVQPYALSGSAGRWLLLVGVSVSSFMLLRRLVGKLSTHRLLRRCTRVDPRRHGSVLAAVQALSMQAGLRRIPEILVLPKNAGGAFAFGGGGGRILIGRALLERLDDDELEGVVAHEIAHLQARDLPLLLVAGLLRDMVAWNPLAHVAHHRLCADRELEADSRAAAMTGRPLAVASGLLKASELAPAGAPIHAGAFWRPGSSVSRRVAQLLDVADGRAISRPAGRLPYVAAACLVAALAFEAGARLARPADPLAIVWGRPPATVASVWSPEQVHGKDGSGEEHRVTSKRLSRAASVRPAVPEFLTADAVPETDVDVWMRRVGRWAGRQGVSPMLLRWEARLNWVLDEPLFAPGRELGLYRMEGLSL